jgi:hypothetical protein
MKSHVFDRVAEINEHLGPLLDELGIAPKIRRDDTDISIGFGSTDGNTVSPVEIELGRKAKTTTTESSWKGSALTISLWRNVPIGDNGWVYQKFLKDHLRQEIKADRDVAFQELSSCLRGHPLLHFRRSREKYSADLDFADAYEAIRRATSSDEDFAINCERGPECDSFVFTWPEGHNWQVLLKGTNVIVLVDGEEELSVDTYELDKVTSAIYQRLRRFRLEAPPMRF